MSAPNDRARAGAAASPGGAGHERLAAPYRTSARPRENVEGAPPPVALGFVVVWFLLGIQALRVWDEPGSSRGLLGLGLGIVVLCVVVPCLPRARAHTHATRRRSR